MLVLNGVTDIFAFPSSPKEAVAVTTNGIVKSDSRAVMGRGIAREADIRFSIGLQLAGYLKKYGNRAFCMGTKRDAKTGHVMLVLTFPTKHDWRGKSDLELIRASAIQLVELCDKFEIPRCYVSNPMAEARGLQKQAL